jgi:hypothetical protein
MSTYLGMVQKSERPFLLQSLYRFQRYLTSIQELNHDDQTNDSGVRYLAEWIL